VGQHLGKRDVESRAEWPFLAAGIAVDPASGDVYLVIAGAGLWKSSDQGRPSPRSTEQGRRALRRAPRSGRPDGWRPVGVLSVGRQGRVDRRRREDLEPLQQRRPPRLRLCRGRLDGSQVRRMWGVRHESGDVGLLSDNGGAAWKEVERAGRASGCSTSTRSWPIAAGHRAVDGRGSDLVEGLGRHPDRPHRLRL
jgi:hypothetical protein